ncbi:MAG: SIMPL domain-containing protein [Anaerolineales bacterium]|nr:SIMPL domain-containing protein [Anaerolineales bacterium]
MKRNKYLALAVLMLGLLLVGSFFGARLVKAESPALSQLQAGDQVERCVTVRGVGEIQVIPDQAAIRLGVQTEAESAQAALQQNNTQIQAVLDNLTEAGIPAEDIQTQSIHLSPRYEFDDETESRMLVGYQASNFLAVQTDELDNLGQILDAAVSAGANTIDSINFQISDPQARLEQARQAAVENALTKAQQLADLTGAILGPVATIQEMGGTPSPVAGSVEFAAGAQAVPIAPGSQSIRAEVQITWTLIATHQQTSPTNTGANVTITPGSGPVGTEVDVIAAGFPANTAVEVGIGHWGSEYVVVQTAATDAQGNLSTQVTIPADAESGEEWVVVVAVDRPLGLKVSSNRFTVTD